MAGAFFVARPGQARGGSGMLDQQDCRGVRLERLEHMLRVRRIAGVVPGASSTGRSAGPTRARPLHSTTCSTVPGRWLSDARGSQAAPPGGRGRAACRRDTRPGALRRSSPARTPAPRLRSPGRHARPLGARRSAGSPAHPAPSPAPRAFPGWGCRCRPRARQGGFGDPGALGQFRHGKAEPLPFTPDGGCQQVDRRCKGQGSHGSRTTKKQSFDLTNDQQKHIIPITCSFEEQAHEHPLPRLAPIPARTCGVRP